MTDERPAAQSSLPWRISWLTIVLGLLTLGTFFAVSKPDVRGIVPMGIPTGGMGYSGSVGPVPPSPAVVPTMMDQTVTSGPSNRMAPGMPDIYPYPYPNQNVPASDTREFLKVYYNAFMRTRDVQGLTRRVVTTVRGYDGRIDQESSSPQYGSVSFVVPQSKYDAFRAELEGLVGKKFLTINVSSQNLLPQKQSIEEQQKQADSSLADYKAARQRIVNAHASTMKAIQSQTDADVQEIETLRTQQQTYDIQVRIQTLSNELMSLQAQLENEKASYAAQLNNADANIKYAQDWQKAVQTQDKALLDNVATVSGTVSIQWISLWDIALLYLPGYWIPGIFGILTILSYAWDRRRFAART